MFFLGLQNETSHCCMHAYWPIRKKGSKKTARHCGHGPISHLKIYKYPAKRRTATAASVTPSSWAMAATSCDSDGFCGEGHTNQDILQCPPLGGIWNVSFFEFGFASSICT